MLSSLVLSYVHSKQPVLGLTQEWFRELSFSKLECGVHDKGTLCLPTVWDLLLPLTYTPDREGTNGSSERHRDKQSLMLRARFLHLIMKHAWSGNRTPTGRVTSGHANHYTTTLMITGQCFTSRPTTTNFAFYE